MPGPSTLIDADIVVAPLPGSPEAIAYRGVLEAFPGPTIVERDPLTALARALAYPRTGFSRLVFGIDPGRACGGIVVGDSYIVSYFREPCESVGGRVALLASRMPHSSLEVYLGNGPGSGTAASSLIESGIEPLIVDEDGTTRRPPISTLESLPRDRDILAALAIALRGAYGGRVSGKASGRDRL